MLTLKHRFHRHVVNEFVHVEGVGLCEAHVADVTLVRLFTSVGADVALQLEGICRSVRAVGALVWAFSRVAAYVAPQFGQLHRSVATLLALMGLFMRVSVLDVAHKLPGRSKRFLAVLAHEWFNAVVEVLMVPQRGHSLEATLANVALVRPMTGVGLHVAH